MAALLVMAALLEKYDYAEDVLVRGLLRIDTRACPFRGCFGICPLSRSQYHSTHAPRRVVTYHDHIRQAPSTQIRIKSDPGYVSVDAPLVSKRGSCRVSSYSWSRVNVFALFYQASSVHTKNKPRTRHDVRLSQISSKRSVNSKNLSADCLTPRAVCAEGNGSSQQLRQGKPNPFSRLTLWILILMKFQDKPCTFEDYIIISQYTSRLATATNSNTEDSTKLCPL